MLLERCNNSDRVPVVLMAKFVGKKVAIMFCLYRTPVHTSFLYHVITANLVGSLHLYVSNLVGSLHL